MTPRLWPVFALAALALCVAATAETCSINMPRPANTYFTDEKVQMTVRLPAPRRAVSARVTDYYGRVRWQGSLSVGGEQPVALTMPEALGAGYYKLDLSWDAGSQQEPFCVLPRPYEDPGDYSLFGLCPGSGSTDEVLETAAQMGVRLVRQTVPWPPLEPARGVWRMELLQDWYDMARRHGIQMMLILGYTPAFLAEKPCNTLNDWWANNAVFTWHPKDHTEYWRYLIKVMDFAQNKTVRWPSAPVLPAQNRPAQQTLPWAHSWEMWNEADICFYMGDWNRYMDLLRMSWASGRQRLPHAPMVYGGSTGNFSAMGMVASGASKYCFDAIALHTGGDVENGLRVWYSGAQQIPWCVGAPRETWHTECYAQGRRGTVDYGTYQETPGELQRCYLTLKAWREAAFFRSGCLGGYVGTKDDLSPGTAMLWSEGGRLTPTPLYPAFAAARKLLSDAVEVGPVNLGDNVTAHLFLKHGTPLLAAWSDEGATVALWVRPTAKRLDPFGGETDLGPQTTYVTRVGAEPLVLLGVEGTRYLPEALRSRFDLLTQTPYGTPQTNAACSAWYANPMQQDLQDLVGSSHYSRLNTAIRQAERCLATAPEQAPAALVHALWACWTVTTALVDKCPPGQELPVKVANNLWRLARMEEWLGEVADDLSEPWQNLQVSSSQVAWLEARVEWMRQRIADHHGLAQLPLAEQLLDRCDRQLWRLDQTPRRGTYTAIRYKTDTTLLLDAVEQGVVLRAVPVVDFSTGRSFRKARLLEPAQTHTLSVCVYNYLDRPISGSLLLKLPAAWSPRQARATFSADPGKRSYPRSIRVTLADTPTPWVQAATFTLDGLLNVSLPSSLADRPLLEVEGRLDTGEPLAPMAYFLNVGRWLDEAAPSMALTAAPASAPGANAQEASGNAGLQLPESVKTAQIQSVLREMENLNRRPRPAGAAVASVD